ncbi:hypothetical protein G5B40_20070 [Pikeienuella piscinae]|uniref:Uncharacterized protein n=1 Tax=Pikeienuella piscinae TaxID=2748098 RepID=A0A7M3T6B0_9RHOB|nr:hypothetical protein [Pikeienuella piscinae]QIE57541.1 hypothetical protein G5B40_20070 [Pikeienuella piscinae]
MTEARIPVSETAFGAITARGSAAPLRITPPPPDANLRAPASREIVGGFPRGRACVGPNERRVSSVGDDAESDGGVFASYQDLAHGVSARVMIKPEAGA